MEVAGLALGVVGVAGILSTLKDVAELYSLFVDSRSIGRDYEMLDTKLDIERTMLLHWADRVGLLRNDYDPRLDIPNTQETVVRLNDLLPATSGPSVSQSEPSPTQELAAQSNISTRGIPHTAQDVVDQKYQDKILETLWFRTMEAREEEIKPAHAKTLNWALEPPDGKVQWDDLSEWLRSGEDIYWVSGKAGSGKSTLMKRLYHHPRTKELLTEWANGGRVTLASFFFWNLGTPEQKNQEGLSRSLLHQILSRHPSLIREALPGMWKELHITKATPSLPTLTETHHAFRTIATKTHTLNSNNNNNHKFCLLIDGLDEFTGDHRHAITFLQELTTNPGFKAIISSRPIPACVAAFEDLPTLPLHRLTHHDIATYVDATLTAHRAVQKLLKTRRHAVKARLLTQAIIEKSTGVFLWVVLACRAVLEGLVDGDGIDAVLPRVNELPPELEDMFKLMLARVNERYREQGAFTLRVCHAISGPDGPAWKYFGNRLGALPVALLCREGAEPGVALEEEDKEEIREELGGWLASRCGGLLVMGGEGHGGVAWVHRSVVEFLNGDGVWGLEYLRVDEGRPRIQAALSVYALHSLMQDNHDTRIIYNMWYCGALVVGARADAEDPEGRDHSLWQIGPYLRWLRQVEPMPPGTESQWPLKRLLVRHTDANQGVAHAALVLAAESGAINYMKAHPDFGEFCKPGVHMSCGCFPLFYHAAAHPLGFSIMSAHPPGPPSALRTTISFFLSLGADPNMPVAYRLSEPAGQTTYLDTPWRGWIGWARSVWAGPGDRAAVADIMAMFLAAGADPTEEVPAWILPYLADPKYRDTLAVSDAQLASAVSALRGEMLQVVQKGKQECKEEDGRPWLHSTARGTVYWGGEPDIET
ncbi:hypothetical protein F5144DRAFT_641863 [Chaetomium tenue]|uniref:Uncharacterized protein n=1 Tax=Chaetomium tenue TaxID=1854479 RepID=A0ACB7PHX9_9PEZI|nr:hypothetical protein F5144DRAFT_641863 [Chaetomium globosum]